MVIFKMKDRKYQFLESVNNLYRKTRRPAHYSDIASFLGVSLNTLLDLSDRGLLKKVYEPDGKRGRAKVLFLPTENCSLMVDSGKDGDLMDCILACHFAIMVAVMKAPGILFSAKCCKDSSRLVVVRIMTSIWDSVVGSVSSDPSSADFLKKVSEARKQFQKTVVKLSDIETRSLCKALMSFFLMADNLVVLGRGTRET